MFANLRRALPPAVAIGVAALAYLPILKADFWGDDFLHFYQLTNFDLLTNLIFPQGGHIYLFRNLLFFCWHKLFGLWAPPYFALLLGLHLLNVGLLYVLLRRLRASPGLACFGAALWGACPLHEGVLTWFAVYGHALAGTTTLLILLQLAAAGAAGQPPSARTRRAIYAIAVVGCTCFGVGLGMALVLPWLAILLVPGWRPWWRPPFASLWLVVPGLYTAVLLMQHWLWKAPSLPLGERLTGAAVANSALAVFKVPAHGAGQLLLGPWWSITDVGWFGAGVLLIALAALALCAPRGGPERAWRHLAAGALVMAATYALVLLGRSGLIGPLPIAGMAINARYHYVPLIGVTIVLCVSLRQWATLGIVPERVALVALALWSAVWASGAVVHPPPLERGREGRLQTAEFIDAINNAAAAAPPGTAIYFRNRVFAQLALPRMTFPGLAAAFTIFFGRSTAYDTPIFFVESDEEGREFARRGDPIGRLLIAPDDMPPGARMREVGGEPTSSNIFRPHHYLNFALDPDAVYMQQHQFNAPYRIRRKEPIRPKATWRALVLGGRTTFGERTAREEDTWVYRLERTLRDRYGPGYDVINGGVPGYNVLENFLHYILLLQDLDPDLVILYVGIDDVYPRLIGHIELDYSNSRLPWRPEDDTQPRAMLVQQPYPPEAQWRAALRRNGSQIYRTHLEDLVRLLLAQNRRVIIVPPVFLPRPDEASDEVFGEAVAEHNQVNQIVARELHVPYVTTVAAPSAFARRDLLADDSSHFNKPGQEKLAQMLFQFLEAQHELPGRAAAAPP